MDVDTAIRSDRATRSFADDPVPKDLIKDLVSLARYAGSGKNRQPWAVVASRDPEILSALADFGQYTTPLRRAPAGLVVIVDVGDSASRFRHNVFDCGRFVQNVKLAATARGLGTCPQSFHDHEGAGEYLGVAETQRVMIGLAIGYPTDGPAATIEGEPKDDVLAHPGRRPVEDMLFWDRLT